MLQPSDEEVLDYDDDDSEVDDHEDYEEDPEVDESGAGREVEDDEDVGGWGPSKKDYYDADMIETEQDALDEEKEALRLQKKQLQGMTEADFGFDENEWVDEDGDKAADSSKVVTEVLPQLQITDDMSEDEKLKILRTRYPEFEPISQEYQRLQPIHNELAAAANAAMRLIKAHSTKSSKKNGNLLPTPMAVTKYRACAAYLAAMSMYFAILGSSATEDNANAIALDPKELHEHPVMETLLQTQELWKKVENLSIGDPMVAADDEDELSVIEEDSAIDVPADTGASTKEKKVKKTKAQRAAEAAQAEAQARRAERLREAEEELGSLASLTDAKALAASRKKKAEKPKINLLNADDSDFGEETEFTAHELAEKAKKKKSLRFYTSQIAQKANKRDAAGKDAGGDADVPHRERLRDREARLQAQAEKKGQNMKGPGVLLGEGGDSDGDDDNDAQPRGNDFEDEEGYYDMVAARGSAKKQEKMDRAAAYAEAAKQGGTVVQEEIIGEDGRRQITYAIQANKGLTPHRAKQNRNPRVKKKLRYEKKKKQLKSMKPVFDAAKKAAGGAKYGGEMTGIKKGLVRSRKL